MSSAENVAAINQIHSDLVDRLILEACEKVRGFVKRADEYNNPKQIIARYVAAVAGNFIGLIGMTYPWVRHEGAQHALKDNLRCEQGHDHIGMLHDFAKQAGVTATTEDFDYVAGHLKAIRNLMSYVADAGLIGLVFLAVLESTSVVFIPVLEDIGKKLDVTDLTYTKVHGEADAKHSAALVAALKAEWTMGYCYHEGHVKNAIGVVVEFLRRIFEEEPLTT
jgi:hypothetical protein